MAKGDFALYDSRFTETRDKLIELESGVFDILMDVLCFAAGLGFEKKYYIETEKSGQPTIKNVLDSYNSQIMAIAIAHESDTSIVTNKEECYKIFSSYVNGGFEFIENLFEEKKLISNDDKIEELLLLVYEKAVQLKTTKKKN